MPHTALVIVDMVKDFTNENGKVFYPPNKLVLPKIVHVLEECRKYGLTIIFLQHCYRKDKYDKNLVNMRQNCIEGSGGEEIDASLYVDPIHDYVIKKRRYSGFFGTDLDLVLRENNVKNVVVVGTKTNCCIRATVTDAYYLDYNAIVLSDCVATNDENVNNVHLQDIAKYLGTVMTSSQFIEKLQKGDLS